MNAPQSINQSLHAIHMNMRTNMLAEVKRQQVDFSPLEHIAMNHILSTGAVSQQMLVESMNKDKAQIARTVARLLRQELIIKQENPNDKRSVLLNLSAKGEVLLKRLNQVQLSVTTELLQDFSDDDVALLSTLLARIDKSLTKKEQ